MFWKCLLIFVILFFSFSRAPFASPKRQAPGSNTDDSEEKEMAIALKEALEATVCMVIILITIRVNAKFKHITRIRH